MTSRRFRPPSQAARGLFTTACANVALSADVSLHAAQSYTYQKSSTAAPPR